MKILRLLTFAVALAATFLVGNGRTPAEWKSRVVYQILTDRFAKAGGASSSCQDLSKYCGGNFRGIIEKLDYIQGLGANAIWISPIPEQTNGGYHGYWQKDIYKINEHFGSSNDLKHLITECHRRDIWIMLDVVANHMGYSDFKNFVPFNKSEHYHDKCDITDWNDQQQVEHCQLAGLPDLDQNHPFVRSTLKDWIHDTIQTYGFDGIRIDTIIHAPKDFWFEYCESAGVYSIGEVFNGNPCYVAGYQGALSALFNYPMFYIIKDVFMNKQSMYKIRQRVNENYKSFADLSLLGNFLDNHDNPRFLSVNSDKTVLKNGLAFVIFSQGIPFIYYGTEQGYAGGHDPANRESLWPNYNTDSDLYRFISTLAKFRTKMGSKLYHSKQIERYVDDQFFAFTRGDKGEVFVATSNIGAGNSLTRTITYHPYPDGTVLQNILDPNDKITVNNKKFTIAIKDGLPLVYTPAGGNRQPHEEL